MELIQLLQKAPFFAGSTPGELQSLVSSSRILQFKEGQSIIQQEDRGTNFFLILEGKVKIVRYTEDGKEIILDTLSTGEHFGEMALLDGMSRSATVEALTAVKVLLIDRASFLRLLQQSPKTLENLLKELSRRLRQANQRIEELSTLELGERLKKIIVDIAKEEGEKSNDGYILKELPTHQNLADMVGASRARVSEAIGHLRKIKFIKKIKDSIFIPDVD